jgi:ATP-dependent DNA helicase PIF1
VTSTEATWRILKLPLFYFSHVVHTLPVHLEGENPVVFKKGEAAEAAKKEIRASMLTAYHDLVRESRLKPEDDPERLLLARILYCEMPKFFTWDQKARKWKRRVKSNKPNLGRLAAASPTSGDRFYQRILLQEIPGCASFEELRTHDGIVLPTFKDACVSRGLARDDAEYKR